MRRSGARPAAVATLGAVLVLLAACSSGSQGSQAKGQATTSVAGGDTAAAGTPNTSFTGAGSSEYCRLSRDYAASAKKFAVPTNAAELRQVFEDAAKDIKAVLAVAPPEIKADVQTLANGLASIMTVMEAANYDEERFAATPPSLPPNFDAASTRIDAYTRNVCGLTG